MAVSWHRHRHHPMWSKTEQLGGEGVNVRLIFIIISSPSSPSPPHPSIAASVAIYHLLFWFKFWYIGSVPAQPSGQVLTPDLNWPVAILPVFVQDKTQALRGCADMNRSYELIDHWLPVTSMLLSLSGVFVVDIVLLLSLRFQPLQCCQLSWSGMPSGGQTKSSNVEVEGRWHCCDQQSTDKYSTDLQTCLVETCWSKQSKRSGRKFFKRMMRCHEWWLVTLILWIDLCFFSINLTKTKSIQIQQSQFRMTDWTVRWYVTGTCGYMLPCCVNWRVTNLWINIWLHCIAMAYCTDFTGTYIVFFQGLWSSRDS